MYGYVSQGRRRLAVELERLRLRVGDARPLEPDGAIETLDPRPSVLFLCYGNICRSPLAERYASAQLSAAGLDDVTVDSAGFHRREGRESPDEAVAVASEYGVDLGDHRSKRVTRELLAGSDLVVLMDAYNYRQLRAEFPATESKAYFLKAFAGSDAGGFEVPDPYGGGRPAFRRVYDHVTTAVDDLVAALDGVDA